MNAARDHFLIVLKLKYPGYELYQSISTCDPKLITITVITDNMVKGVIGVRGSLGVIISKGKK